LLLLLVLLLPLLLLLLLWVFMMLSRAPLQLWASSKVLASSSMKCFFDRCVPRNKQAACIK